MNPVPPLHVIPVAELFLKIKHFFPLTSLTGDDTIINCVSMIICGDYRLF